MGQVRQRQPVKFIASLLTARLELLPEVRRALERELGDIDYVSPLLPFNDTNYYEAEFGPGLQREIVTFKPLRDMADLASVKNLTNALEMRWSQTGQRQVNIDPGYIALGKFVLATTKDQAHRIYIGQGIFAEVTLRYRKGSFEAWEWTYPDYASPSHIALLNELRQKYREQLKREFPMERSETP
jgi:hypothetical protein